jgi:integrase
VPRNPMPEIKRQDDVKPAVVLSRTGGPAKYKAGDGLYLITRRGHGFWQYQFRQGASMRSKGFGSACKVTMATAHKAREKLRYELEHGLVALPHSTAVASAPVAGDTFGYWVARYLANEPAAKTGKAWTEDKRYRVGRWLNELGAKLLPLPVSAVTPLAIMQALGLDATCTATADRARRIVLEVLAYSRGEIGAAKPEDHGKARQPSLPYARVAEFVRSLGHTVPERSLRFLILTGVRASDVIEAEWQHVDLAARTWLIPETKNGQPLVVPLTQAMLACLGMPGTGRVFPDVRGRQWGKLCKGWASDTPGREAVPHGFRSTFSTWAADNTSYPEDVREMVAHERRHCGPLQSR